MNQHQLIQRHSEAIVAAHFDLRPFIALHPDQGIVLSAEDEETFEAKLNDCRPSLRNQLLTTHTNLHVHCVTNIHQ